MKKVMLMLTIAAIGFAANAQTTKVSKNEKSKAVKTEQQKDSVYYQCPMHPEEISAKLSKCSKCGMNLEKKTIKISKKKDEEKETAQAVYYCPMHPAETSDKPGKCPKCGMSLVKK